MSIGVLSPEVEQGTIMPRIFCACCERVIGDYKNGIVTFVKDGWDFLFTHKGECDQIYFGEEDNDGSTPTRELWMPLGEWLTLLCHNAGLDKPGEWRAMKVGAEQPKEQGKVFQMPEDN